MVVCFYPNLSVSCIWDNEVPYDIRVVCSSPYDLIEHVDADIESYVDCSYLPWNNLLVVVDSSMVHDMEVCNASDNYG